MTYPCAIEILFGAQEFLDIIATELVPPLRGELSNRDIPQTLLQCDVVC